MQCGRRWDWIEHNLDWRLKPKADIPYREGRWEHGRGWHIVHVVNRVGKVGSLEATGHSVPVRPAGSHVPVGITEAELLHDAGAEVFDQHVR